MTELSVVMPVYNEEGCIAESIRRIEAFMSHKNPDWELLIVSDASRDRTDQIVRSRAISEPRIKLLVSPTNMGKGAAVRRGMLAATGRFVLMTDADLSSPMKESDKLIAALENGYDVAIGSRADAEPGTVHQSFKRRVSGRIFNLFVKSLVLRNFKDTQCGFKCFRREAAQTLFSQQKLNGFSFDVEVLYLALNKGFTIKEVPVMWREGKHSKIRLLKDSFRMLAELWQIKYNKYDFIKKKRR